MNKDDVLATLREINFLITEDYDYMVKGVYDYIKSLEQENKQLKEELDKASTSLKKTDKNGKNLQSDEDILYNQTQAFGRAQFVRELARLMQENKELKETIKIKDHWLELIYDIGFDHDGYSDAENLMKLIDELVQYSASGIKNTDPEEWRKEQEEHIRKAHENE